MRLQGCWLPSLCTWTVLEKRTSTGKVRPLMWKTGTLPKKSLNLALSSVALVTISLKSRRLATTWHACSLRSGAHQLSCFNLCKISAHSLAP